MKVLLSRKVAFASASVLDRGYGDAERVESTIEALRVARVAGMAAGEEPVIRHCLRENVERGRVATVRRDSRTTAFVDQERLRYFLASVSPSRAEIVPEDGGWSIVLPGPPVAADGATVDEALDETIVALREYAEDWQDRLLDTPNHAANWGVVQLICLSDDTQLRDWLVGTGR
jgi:predicted RNase H-like HicB family nuclease